MKRKLITGIGVRKRLFPISAIIAILCLTPMFVIWTFAQSDTATLTIITASGNFKGKGNCLLASSGEIEADLPPTYYWGDSKTYGGVTWAVECSYTGLQLPLTLVEEVQVHIHIDGSYRRLIENVPVDITMLSITGCTERPVNGAQYCVNAHSPEIGNIGTVTRTGPNTWLVDALIPDSEQGPLGLCVSEWSEGERVDGFCIPLQGLSVAVKGTITK